MQLLQINNVHLKLALILSKLAIMMGISASTADVYNFLSSNPAQLADISLFLSLRCLECESSSEWNVSCLPHNSQLNSSANRWPFEAMKFTQTEHHHHQWLALSRLLQFPWLFASRLSLAVICNLSWKTFALHRYCWIFRRIPGSKHYTKRPRTSYCRKISKSIGILSCISFMLLKAY